MWMTGGSIQGGTTIGKTDDFSYNIIDEPTKIADINATIFHCMGIDHNRLTVKFQGLPAKVTGVEKCKVLKKILA